MNLVESSTKILKQEGGSIANMMKFITKVGYTCYKTNKEITNEVAAAFVDGLIKRGHGAMLEHGTVFLAIPAEKMKNEQVSKIVSNLISYHLWTRYTEKIMNDKLYLIIVTNFRVIVENNLQQFMKDYWYIPTQDERKCRPTVKFIVDRIGSQSIVRHRVFSFAQESTRYCNYAKEKFGASVTFTQPDWIKSEDQTEFEEDCATIEKLYFKWLDKGYPAQLSRYFLNFGIKTEIIVTGFADDWQHFFDLRALDKTGPAHPDIKKLALPLYQEFLKLDIIEEKQKQEEETKQS